MTNVLEDLNVNTICNVNRLHGRSDQLYALYFMHLDLACATRIIITSIMRNLDTFAMQRTSHAMCEYQSFQPIQNPTIMHSKRREHTRTQADATTERKQYLYRMFRSLTTMEKKTADLAHEPHFLNI